MDVIGKFRFILYFIGCCGINNIFVIKNFYDGVNIVK